jgi:hypothetical protein
MTGIVMKRVPHRHVGESLDDELSDLQEIKTTLHRQFLDNIYLVNNSRTAVNERVNLKDALSNTPGGLVRIKGDMPIGDSMSPIIVAPILDKIIPAIDYWDKTKETRTGVRPGSDMDPDVLKETTKGAYLESLNRASQKIEMITRMLAEGVREAVLQCHSILIRHQNQARVVQLRGKWTPVNPREWKERTDLKVRVGLGTGSEEEKRQKLQLLSGLQGQLLQAAAMAPPPVYGKMYALFEDVAKAMDFDMPEKYGLAPSSPEYQQMVEEKKNQPNPEVQKFQAEMAAKERIEQMRTSAQMETDRNRQEMEAQQQAAKIQMERERDREKAEREFLLEREKLHLTIQRDIRIAEINAGSRIDAAQITAGATLSAQQESATDAAVTDNGPMPQGGMPMDGA